MILHLGSDYFVKTKEILMILDYEEAACNKDTSLFLKDMETTALAGKPRAVVITEEQGTHKAYLSPISPRTLMRRGSGDKDAFLRNISQK
ncbi:extracellular matrix regulator RemB [Christensenella tenuis]|jgi:hypothetical protein|uniref:DUF370 domain-containing protein n=1 Tax=Christensenella tenuis TaxID=2763033 RepID=A0ABR7EF73_9FIRM|nr:extracellular matrix/biofilm biosynthesis regulator RemA family protein [Christensenella tenuis]MBC5648432.1 DUF370 domain-containing protein [Christensenella tenuis]